MSERDDPRGPGPTPTPGGSDPVPDAAPLDELASALVDGEATVDERARAADPAVAARVADFERVAELTGAPVPAVGDAERERAVAAALAAWGTADDGATGRVDELASRREASRRSLRLVGIAAAVVAALAVGGVALSGGSDDDETATAPVEEAGGEDDAATGSAAGAAADSAASVPLPADLGTFDDVDDLLAAAASFSTAESLAVEEGAVAEQGSDTAGAPSAPTASRAEDFPSCPVPGGGSVATAASALLDGRSVVVYVTETADGVQIVVLDAATCDQIAERSP